MYSSQIVLRIARKMTLLSYFSLMGLLIFGITQRGIYPDTPRAILLLGLVGPMMLPLRGLLRGKRYTHAWSSFLSLLYVVFAVDAWAAKVDIALAASELLLAILWFSGCVLYARLSPQAWRE